MSPRNQSRITTWLVVAFAVGAGAGFLWALNRPHPASSYRATLDAQRAAQG